MTPPTAGRFLGRERDVGQLQALIGDCALVTLTGAPGVGKTRLAAQVAGSCERATTWVELARVPDGERVPRALAAALSVQEAPGRPLVDTLAAHLRGRALLLVLDNCEHLVAACASVVDALLRACPQLRVLATSREPLGLAAEVVWHVEPLPVPAAGAPSLPEAALRYEAVALFVERAAAAEPGFALNAYLAPDVTLVCRRLDGIPLAIELAAARVATFTPAEIAHRLDDRFRLLQATGPSAAHHDTLEAALDWSHELLSAPERAVLRRASIFAGAFGLDAARAVCAGGDVEPGEVEDLLARLGARSLLDSRSPAPGRHLLLETIRAYGARKLEDAGEVATARRAHARFYLELAEHAEPHLTGPRQRRWLERLEDEREDLRRALEWSLGHGEGEWALRLAGALVLFWRVRCHFGEGRELLDAVVSATEAGTPALRAKALWGAGFMALMAGDGAGVAAVQDSLTLADQLGDVQGRARALLLLGNARQSRGDPAALSLLDESAAAAREAGDAWCHAHALGCAGLEHCHRDELAAARPLLERCIAVAREARDNQGLRFGMLGLAEVAARQGDFRLAESVYADTLAVAEELGEQYTKGTVLMHLGQCAVAQGEYDRARAYLDDALVVLREARPTEVVVSLVLRARVARAQGDRPAAERLLGEALPLARAGSPGGAAAIHDLGELAAESGESGTAQRLLAESLELARQAGDRRGSASALHSLGQLARAGGDAKRAGVQHREALALRHAAGDARGVAVSLAAIGGLVAAGGRWEIAARLFGAAEAAAANHVGWEGTLYDADRMRVREQLSEARFRTLIAEGAGLALDDAVAQASVSNGNGRPAAGWGSLTDTERQVADLMVRGLTNREIADSLFLSLGTVKKNVSRVLAKLGCRRRADVAREATRLPSQPWSPTIAAEAADDSR